LPDNLIALQLHTKHSTDFPTWESQHGRKAIFRKKKLRSDLLLKYSPDSAYTTLRQLVKDEVIVGLRDFMNDMKSSDLTEAAADVLAQFITTDFDFEKICGTIVESLMGSEFEDMSASSAKRGQIITANEELSANEELLDMRMLPPIVLQIRQWYEGLRNQALEDMVRLWVNNSFHSVLLSILAVDTESFIQLAEQLRELEASAHTVPRLLAHCEEPPSPHLLPVLGVDESLPYLTLSVEAFAI
jgi:hypothetical protein